MHVLRALAAILSLASPVLGAAAAPARTRCSPELVKLEALTTERFDPAWPMCRLYGNYEPKTRTSRGSDLLATVQLSQRLDEGDGVPRHLLVIGRQYMLDGEVVDSHGSYGWSDVHVYARREGRWALEKSSLEVIPGGSNGNLAGVKLVRLGPRRFGISASGGGTFQGTTFGSVRLLSVSGPAIVPATPYLRSQWEGCEDASGDEEDVRACEDVETGYTLQPGADPEWLDLVVTITGSERSEETKKLVRRRETISHVHRGWHYVPVPAPADRDVTVWSGTVGDTPVRLALLGVRDVGAGAERDPDEWVGTLRHGATATLVFSQATGSGRTLRLDELEEGTLSGTFRGEEQGDRYAGAWRRPFARRGVGFTLVKVRPEEATPGPGRWEAVGATMTLAAGEKGQLRLSARGPGALELSGIVQLANDGKVAVYADARCRLELRFRGEALVVSQLTPYCGAPGTTLDSGDVGPYLRAEEPPPASNR